MIQTRMISFTNAILGKSWIKWFKQRHPQLVLKASEALEMNRDKSLNQDGVAQFYQNLKEFFLQHQYMNYGKCRNVMRIVHKLTRMEKGLFWQEKAQKVLPNYYVFKGKRPKQ